MLNKYILLKYLKKSHKKVKNAWSQAMKAKKKIDFYYSTLKATYNWSQLLPHKQSYLYPGPDPYRPLKVATST